MTFANPRSPWQAFPTSNASGADNHCSSSTFRFSLLLLGGLLLFQQIHHAWQRPLCGPPNSIPSTFTLQVSSERLRKAAYLPKVMQVDEARPLPRSLMRNSVEAPQNQVSEHSKHQKSSLDKANAIKREHSQQVTIGEKMTIHFALPENLEPSQSKREYRHKHQDFTKHWKRGLSSRLSDNTGKLVEIRQKDFRSSTGTSMTSPKPKIETFEASTSRRTSGKLWMSVRKAILEKHPGMRAEPATAPNLSFGRQPNNLPSASTAEIEAARRRAQARWRKVGNQVQAISAFSMVGRMVGQAADQALEKTYHGLEWLENMIQRCEPIIEALKNFLDDLEMKHQYHLAQELIGIEVFGLEAFGI